ncbi:glycosyltransferase [Pedobacter fastidiosus]|uniref:Glycosyltransferase n=1 Tax=Pedobacter fastidiosus TaxID=2765361 RepID=A0ABR7KUT0_9SPHI|nr:glycosyltransferase [Pedobacter fastidiosus]MBC6111858.1 glycosyltransferase [Pedobacter fastidiosus]
MKKIIIIGPSIERTKGGIASVIKGFLESNSENFGYKCFHYVSHVEGGGINKILFFLKCFFKLLFTKKIALVHIHTACDASFYRKALFAVLSRVKGVPVFMHIHGADFDDFYLKSNVFLKSFIRYLLVNCSRVIVLSNYWKVFFEDNLNLKNLEILNNAVNVDLFCRCCSVPKNIHSFLFLGRLGERKGTYDLIKAIDLIINRDGLKHFKFYFAGDGEIEESKKIITDLNLNNYVDVLGWVDNEMKLSVLSKADTVILPSYNEGLPVALLEAMAAGKVILSTPVGGIPDLVAEGVNGFLVQPGDVDDLASKIKFISEYPEKMKEISSANILAIENEYSTPKINKQLFQLYDVFAL